MDDYRLETMGTCLLLEANDALISSIDAAPFEMCGGDTLNVGDKFTAIDKTGSAGLPPILLNDGWCQQYEGSVDVNSYGFATEHVLKLRLFTAFRMSTSHSATASFASDFDHMYLAYIDSGHGSMSYWNSCGSGRRVKCKSITRVRNDYASTNT